MKKYLLLLLLSVSLNGMAQEKNHYKKVFNYGEYKTDWALVQNITGTYGFINKEGKEVVPAIYLKIYPFETHKNKKYALIKNVAGAYGFIDENGQEAVKAIYWKKEEATQQLTMLTKK
ncbi:WG repeat-containing protein [Flavobacterium silvisoli]|uniref:WG repeat-containing protein n=1 Tax=Flavobacterium silvisoli TaxID=2529433 RepID=A0A4Q9Z770_9FLAO|nr:WG repeat-containing protein [Flavobacterium silvisoli]TBX69913.1 WG repeat-containing protein [Flavobacterium silvisoli]